MATINGTTVKTIKFERKRNGTYEGTLNLVQSNAFIARLQMMTLKQEGYTVVPAQYERDSRGLCTNNAWLYRAHRKNRTIWIHVNYQHKFPI